MQFGLANPGCETRVDRMAARYFEDLKKGALFLSAPFHVTEEGIIDFADQYDPQAFHLDPEKARRSVFGGLAASGWHTAAITMRLFVQTVDFAEGAIGLGVDELRWPVPVRPGDELRVQTEIVDVRASKSKPDHGIIRLRNMTTNQRGEVVQTMEAGALVPRRP
jgi:acyl dehydratase